VLIRRPVVPVQLAQAELEKPKESVRFVFVQPRMDRPSPIAPPKAPASDLNREGMHPVLELVIECFHDGAVLGDSRFAGERIRNDSDAEMRLAFGTRPRMPLMSCALVDHFKSARGELRRKFCNNRVTNGHMCSLLPFALNLRRT